MNLVSDKSKIVVGIIAALLLIGAIFVFVAPNTTGLFGVSSALSNTDDSTIRIGWLSSFAESAYVVEPLKNNNILSNNSVKAEYLAFATGPAVNEAAMSGKIDAIFVGWIPAASLLSHSDDWFIASKLGDFHVGLIVRNDLNLNSISDLKGKKIGVPFGSGPYLLILNELYKNGLDSKKDVTLVNIKPADLPLALETKQVDVVSWAEPTASLLTDVKKSGYNLKNLKSTAVVIVSKNYASAHPKELQELLLSVKEATLYFAQNKEQVFEWFSKDAQFDLNTLKIMKRVDPVYSASTLADVNLVLPVKDISEIQSQADLGYETGFFPQKIDFNKAIDLSYLG
jgi:ABC-type nitrate/sulfonate/bicarbonate transport system substrate-binding protein